MEKIILQDQYNKLSEENKKLYYKKVLTLNNYEGRNREDNISYFKDFSGSVPKSTDKIIYILR